jgi:predicted metalloprotease with PDZ domain
LIETQHSPAIALRVVQREELGSEPAPRAGVIPGDRTVAIAGVRLRLL